MFFFPSDTHKSLSDLVILLYCGVLNSLLRLTLHGMWKVADNEDKFV